MQTKEVCNGGVACSLLKLGSLEKTVIEGEQKLSTQMVLSLDAIS